MTEINLEKEQMSLAASSKEARVVLEDLKWWISEVNTCEEKFGQEMAAHGCSLQKPSSVQVELKVTVENLIRQLEIRDEETEVTRWLMEMKIELKCKEPSEQGKRRIYGLEY